MIVYDLDGVAHEKQPIDARECVEVLGWTTEQKIEQEATDKEATTSKPVKK
jgi:hypothetical protein